MAPRELGWLRTFSMFCAESLLCGSRECLSFVCLMGHVGPRVCSCRGASIRQLYNMACRPRRRESTITLAEQIAYKKLSNPPPLLHVEMLEQTEDCAWTFVYWVLLANTKQRKVFRHDNERRARVVWKMLVACECESVVARSVSRIYAVCPHDSLGLLCRIHSPFAGLFSAAARSPVSEK